MCFRFFVLFFFGVSFGEFKGQGRWPEGPPYLALTPPYIHIVFFVYFFPVSAFRRKTCFPRKKGILACFSVSPFFFSLAFCLTSLFHSLFLCLSLSLLLFSFFFASFLSFCFLLLPFPQNLVDVQKHCTIGISAHFKSKKTST